MKIVHHRVNELLENAPQYVEIDVHIDYQGVPVARHFPDDMSCDIIQFIEQTGTKGYFVDIKQNLSVEHYKRMVDIFGDKLIGFFDVPWPAVYYLQEAKIPGLKVYNRVSEFELPHGNFFNCFWVDPLVNQDIMDYVSMISWLPKDSNIMICCPSLHGHEFDYCQRVWKAIGSNRAEGIVTKFSDAAEEFFNA